MVKSFKYLFKLARHVINCVEMEKKRLHGGSRKSSNNSPSPSSREFNKKSPKPGGKDGENSMRGNNSTVLYIKKAPKP